MKRNPDMGETDKDESLFHIGQRVMVAEEVFGTVAFIGSIPKSSGQWLGIDWDDADRGRHDGTFQGHRYFSTRHPTSGSFVRPNKVSCGLSLLEAIDLRYCRGWEQLQDLQNSGLITTANLSMNSNSTAFRHRQGLSLQSAGSTSSDTLDLNKPFDYSRTWQGQHQTYRFAEPTMVSGIDPQEAVPPINATNSSNSIANSLGVIGQVQIELVGFNDVVTSEGDLVRQKQILLHGVAVSVCFPNEVQRCRQILPNVLELNVAHTLISDWSTVAMICSAFPKLCTLIVSDNCIRLPYDVSLAPDSESNIPDPIHYIPISNEDCVNISTVAFQNITKLVAVRMNYNSSQFCDIMPWFPHLEHLVLAYNGIESTKGALSIFPTSLRVLDLAGNTLSSANVTQETIDILSCLPHLETLYLNECQLGDFTLPVEYITEHLGKEKIDVQMPLPSGVFPSLKFIGLCRNLIQSWNTLSHLNRLSCLEELTIMENPVLETCANYETARQWVIARMGGIRSLNRNEVNKDERKGAEIDYLRTFGREWIQAIRPLEQLDGCTENIDQNCLLDARAKRLAFIQSHPRYEELIRKHGAPEVAELKQFTTALREGLINVTITCPSKTEIQDVKKKLPSRMTVQHLQALVRRIFKLPSNRAIRLAYSHPGKPNVEYPMEAPTREMGFYDIESGDTIIVQVV